MDETLTVEQRSANHATWRHIHRVQQLLLNGAKQLMDRTLFDDKKEIKEKILNVMIKHYYVKNKIRPKFHKHNEVWLPVFIDDIDFSEHYKVSNYGDICSINRIVNRSGPTGNTLKYGRIMAQEITPRGYSRIQLQAGKFRKNAMVHRLVATAFHPNPENKPHINHKNGIRLDNRVDNLEWTTECDNLQHAYDMWFKKPSAKYFVICKNLNITTFSCSAMENILKEKGYKKASASSIQRCILSNKKARHMNLEFIGGRLEIWMNSPFNNMNLIDLIEIFYEWQVQAGIHNIDIKDLIKIAADHFGMDPILRKIFENTIETLPIE